MSELLITECYLSFVTDKFALILFEDKKYYRRKRHNGLISEDEKVLFLLPWKLYQYSRQHFLPWTR